MTGWKEIALDLLADAGIERARGAVRVPYRNRDGRELFCKWFGSNGRSWYEPAGIEIVPFGLETLPPTGSLFPRYCALLVCEGESDALAVRSLFATRDDARAVRYFALALPGASSWRDTWRSLLEPFPLVYVLGDGDEPGRRMNRRVRAAVPWARPVWLPDGEDVRSLLQHDPEALDPLLAEADIDARLWAALLLSPDLDAFERRLSKWTT